MKEIKIIPVEKCVEGQCIYAIEAVILSESITGNTSVGTYCSRAKKVHDHEASKYNGMPDWCPLQTAVMS